MEWDAETPAVASADEGEALEESKKKGWEAFHWKVLEKLKTLSQWQLARHRRVLEPLIRQILTNRVLHFRGLADIESFREVFRTACLIVYRTCFR